MNEKKSGWEIFGIISIVYIVISLGVISALWSNSQGDERICSYSDPISVIGSFCSNNMEFIKFKIDTHEQFVMGADSRKCVESYVQKYGHNPSGVCILESASSYGEAAMGNAQFLSEYECSCLVGRK